jgi:hypothetical protein
MCGFEGVQTVESRKPGSREMPGGQEARKCRRPGSQGTGNARKNAGRPEQENTRNSGVGKLD